MTGVVLVAAVAAAAAVWMLWPPRPGRGLARGRSTAVAPAPTDAGLLHRWRPVWSLLAGAGAATFLAGPIGLVVGAVLAVMTWVAIGRMDPPGIRRRQAACARQLPLLVDLFGIALAAGAAPAHALAAARAALPGPAAERLAEVQARLALGVDPEPVWRSLITDPALAPLGRAMARAQASGSSVATTIARLSDELARAGRADVEGRARAVGVRAAIPLGVCLLPAFLLLGVVPVVAGLLTTIGG